MNKPRYSGYDTYGPPTEEEWLQNSSSSSTSSSSSGMSSWNWSGILDGVLGIGKTFVTSYYDSKGNKVVAQANETMLKKQEQINTILWVAIGLILALGVFLVVRKTK